MPNYAEMYQKLFRAQTKAIEILQEAQRDTEEMYISAPEANITVLKSEKPGDVEPDLEE